MLKSFLALIFALATLGPAMAQGTPTTLSGMPVKVAGVITYNFVLQ